MSFFLLFFILFSGTAFFSITLKRKFEEALPIFLLLVILMLYIGGLFSNLLIGMYLSFFVCICGITLFLFSIIKKNKRTHISQTIFTPGFVAFILILIFVYIIDFQRYFSVWDEYSHWGVMLKEILRLNTFHCVPESALSIHKDYPPAIQLFEYFWIKVSGSYSEPNTYRAIHFFTLGLMLPAFKNINFKKLIKFVPVLAIIIIVPSVLGLTTEGFYNSIYIDITTGILFGYALFCILSVEKPTLFSNINLFLTVFVIMITKQIGIFFVLALLLVIAFKLLNIQNLRNIKLNAKLFLNETFSCGTEILIAVVAAISASVTWKLVLSYNKVTNIQFNAGDISIGGFVNVLRGNCLAYQSSTLRNFVDAIFSSQPIVPFFQLTYFQLFIIFSAVAFIIHTIHKGTALSKNIAAYALVLPILSVAYAGVLLLLYLFSFGSYEGPNLASYQRYALTFWTGILASFVMLLAIYMPKEDEKRKNVVAEPIAWIIASMLFCGIITPSIVYTDIFTRNEILYGVPDITTRQQAEDLGEYIDINQDKVYLIIQGDKGKDYWITKYILNPINTNENFSWSIGEKVDDKDVWTKTINAAEWSKILIEGNYDLVYIVRENEAFREEFGGLFETLDDNLNGGLYRITVTDLNDVILIKSN